MEKIAVIGTGYVGLVAGAIFAANGHRVICADIDKEKIASLQSGTIPIYEPGLKEIVDRTVTTGNLSFTVDVAAAVRQSTVIFIAVGTPSDPDGSFNMKYIKAATETIAEVNDGTYKVVVLKSTVDPDMFAEVQRMLGSNVDVVSNPEFMAEGTAVRDFSQPNRVIIGTNSEKARKMLYRLYQDFLKRDTHRILFMSPASAIVTKLASNGMLAVRVAYVNEVAEYCDAVGADVEEVRVGMSYDPRIGEHFLFAGPGYGGSCFPKDIMALQASSRKKNLTLPIMSSVQASNEAHKLHLPKKIERHFGTLKDKTFALWGLAFKARTDDVRESPALDVVRYLVERGAKIRAHDPQAMENAKRRLPQITYCKNKEDALEGADALIILTEWDEYKNPDVALIKKTLSSAVIFDGRNILDPNELEEAGLSYVGIGR